MNSNTDRDRRVRQIQERWSVKVSNTKSWGERPTLQSIGGMEGAMADIDYLLSLLDSQAACTWECEPDPDVEAWETACGNTFQFESGGPSENKMRYCCYCGANLIEAAANRAEGDGDADND